MKGLSILKDHEPLIEALPRPMAVGRLIHNAKVAEAGYYAIIPTAQTPTTGLPESLAKIYDLICQRLMTAPLPARQDGR